MIAISFVILGHINFLKNGYIANNMTETGTFNGWFPYYSFHLPIFLFITGYYFRDFSKETGFFKNLGKFAGRKFIKLMVPYYIFSGLSLLAGTVIAGMGFTFSNRFSLSNWLLAPWVKPYIISFSTPAWYLTALFIAEIYFVLLRKLTGFIKKETLREIIMLALTLVLGIGAVYLSSGADVSPAAIVYLRSVVMLFFIQLGLFYRKIPEQFDTLPSAGYFAIVFALQLLIIILSGSSRMSPGLYELLDFGRTGWLYFAAGITGIMLWLRISRLLAAIPKKSALIRFAGANTKYIMALHVFGWFLLNGLLEWLNNIADINLLRNFSSGWYHSYLYYACTEDPRMIVLYYLAGMTFSLLVAWAVQSIKSIFSKKIKAK